jgi:macrolide transport system ATP-binding/permease protein
MRIIDILRLRLRSLLHRSQVEEELDAELRYHVEREAEQRGALLTAGIEQRKEECRDARGLSLVDTTWQDLRYGLRQLRKNPAFAFTTVFVLTLGIAAAATVLAFVDAALIRPLPYRDQSRLIGVYESAPAYPRSIISYLDFKDWQRMNSAFSSLDAYALNGNFTLTTSTGLEQVTGTRVSAGFFRTLGVTPILGRDFLPSEDTNSAAQTVMISYPAWQKRFGGRRGVLGQVLNLNGSPTTIIGVLPAEFQFALYSGEFYGNLRSTSSGCEHERGCRNLLPIGRLKDGVSLDQATVQMRAIAMQLKRQYPAENSDVENVRLIPLRELIIGDVRPILLVLLAGAALLLLIACVNVSTLLLARSNRRGREIAVRRALGASRARLFRQFALEGILLAAAGCGIGLLTAQWGIRALVTLVPAEQIANMPFLKQLAVSPLTVASALCASTLAAALFALIPILSDVTSDMGTRGSTGTSWRRLGSRLVVLEVAVAMVLMVGAALLGQSLYRLLHLDLGFNPDHLALAGTMWRPEDYTSDAKQVVLFRDLERQIAAVPGVRSVGLCVPPPVDSDWFTGSMHIVGQPNHGETNEVYQRPVSAGFFGTIQARLLQGRMFRDDEDSSKPLVAIVNQVLVRRYLRGGKAVGQSIYFDWDPKHPMQIAGVVADIKEGPLQGTNTPAVYRPIYQHPNSWPTILVRTRESESAVLPRVADAIHRIDPFIAVSGEESLTNRINRSPASYLHRSAAYVVGIFAGAAMLLSVVGLYGVVAYSVSQRTREIGLRMALGAGNSTVQFLILSEAGRLTALGVGCGLAGSLCAATLLRNLLFGVSAWDLPTLIGVAAVLGFSALLASYIPARRAASVNPVEALRAE